MVAAEDISGRELQHRIHPYPTAGEAIAAAVAEEREPCAKALDRAYLACTAPGVFNRRVWAEIVEEAQAAIRASGAKMVHPRARAELLFWSCPHQRAGEKPN
jgi:hypothetical protein